MPLTYFLAQVMGLYIFIIGLSMLLWKKKWWNFVNHLIKPEGQSLGYALGMVTLPIGLLLVLSHSYFNQGTLALVVSVIGWLIFLKGILVLALSPEQMGKWVRGTKVESWWYLYGAVLVVVGFWLAQAGFSMPMLGQ